MRIFGISRRERAQVIYLLETKSVFIVFNFAPGIYYRAVIKQLIKTERRKISAGHRWGERREEIRDTWDHCTRESNSSARAQMLFIKMSDGSALQGRSNNIHQHCARRICMSLYYYFHTHTHTSAYFPLCIFPMPVKCTYLHLHSCKSIASCRNGKMCLRV